MNRSYWGYQRKKHNFLDENMLSLSNTSFEKSLEVEMDNHVQISNSDILDAADLEKHQRKCHQ